MLARLADRSPDAALFMCQLLYWWGVGHRPGFIYKTVKDFESETCLSRTKQERAIRIWKQLGVLRVEYHNIPRRRYFQIDVDRLLAHIERIKGSPITLETEERALDFRSLFSDFPRTTTESTAWR